jgi:hypothetical protein
MTMGTKTMAAAAVLVAAACVYFVVRTEPPRMAAIEPAAADVERPDPLGAAVGTPTEDPTSGAVRRSPVAEEPPTGVSAVRGTNLLCVVLEGITEESARRAKVTLKGVDTRDERHTEPIEPVEIRDSWSCEGRTRELDLDPFLASVAEQHEDLRALELEVEVDHPLYLRQRIEVPLSDGVEEESGQTVYEVRVPLVPPAFWPEFSLVVRDANTREHLEGVELCCVSTAFMGVGQHPEPRGGDYTWLGDGLSSPIALRGGHEADDPEQRVAGMVLRPVSGEEHQLFTLSHNGRPMVERGLIVFARAPGYAWAKTVVELSTGADRELLLGPETTLGVRLANVQSERYAELGMRPLLTVGRLDPNGDVDLVWHQDVDEELEAEGLRLAGLVPGAFVVKVKLSPGWQRKPTALAHEELSLAAGEERELLVTLADPPEPPAIGNLGGVVSFPNFGGEENVQLELFRSDYKYGNPDHVLSLAELEPVGGALPTWSFHMENLPADRYQILLRPFMKSWVIELPAGGREDVALVVPKLAEVFVETVDARTGQRVPVERIAYRTLEVIPDQVTNRGSPSWSVSEFEDEAGRFRFWATPGAMHVTTSGVPVWPTPGTMNVTASGIPSGLMYSDRAQDFELVHGLQSVRLELAPPCTIRFEFRVDGAPLPYEDGIFGGLSRCIRAVGHDGRVGGMYPYSLVWASAPGPYEISFEGIGTDRFLPIPPRRVEVREGETTEVIVELRRK